jgi:hypothetical protein
MRYLLEIYSRTDLNRTKLAQNINNFVRVDLMAGRWVTSSLNAFGLFNVTIAGLVPMPLAHCQRVCELPRRQKSWSMPDGARAAAHWVHGLR